MAKTKSHQSYKSPITGKKVPGATTVINDSLGWNKGALIGWARKTAMAGEDPNKVRDKAADIGTLAHALVEEYLVGTPLDRSEYAPADLDIAENAYLAYLDWEQDKDLHIIGSELQLAHPYLMYGGTIDMVAELNGKPTLVDFKTSNNVYNDHVIQVAAYRKLLIDNEEYEDLGQVPVIILHIAKDGRFTEHKFTTKELFPPWQVFAACLQIRNLKGSMPL